MNNEEKIVHAILTDDIDGNLISDSVICPTYNCKKCGDEYILKLQDDICHKCEKKPIYRIFFDKLMGGK